MRARASVEVHLRHSQMMGAPSSSALWHGERDAANLDIMAFIRVCRTTRAGCNRMYRSSNLLIEMKLRVVVRRRNFLRLGEQFWVPSSKRSLLEIAL
jgi:hypothetical protein